MLSIQRAILLLGDLLLLGILAGLVVRRRYRACYTFAAYIAAVLVPQLMISIWPARFFLWDFWLFKESLHALLKFAIALELTIRTFRAFPGARATARPVLFVVLVATFVTVFAATGPTADYQGLAGQVLPRILNGTIWMFSAIAGLILWYRLPVDPLHKAILLGFVPYLLAFTVAMNVLDAFGWQLRDAISYLHTLGYGALQAYWAYAAWRPAPVAAPVLRDPTRPGTQGAAEELRGV